MRRSKMRNNVLFLTDPTNSLWVCGWTHYQMAGQTEARMNQLTREVEVKDGRRWVKCVSGSHEFFIAKSNLDYSARDNLKAGSCG